MPLGLLFLSRTLDSVHDGCPLSALMSLLVSSCVPVGYTLWSLDSVFKNCILSTLQMYPEEDYSIVVETLTFSDIFDYIAVDLCVFP